MSENDGPEVVMVEETDAGLTTDAIKAMKDTGKVEFYADASAKLTGRKQAQLHTRMPWLNRLFSRVKLRPPDENS
ncbi:MAG: hypothetical protein Q8L37_04965 [Candidatus Gottesmanbacteria bacterium]|nr:hypothetical protein [Candidatus Gottesmanbacteria bacterium]